MTLGFHEVRLVWMALGAVALVAAALFTWRCVERGTAERPAPAPRQAVAAVAIAVAWVLAGTIAANLALGQSTPLLLLACVAALALRGARPFLAGFLLGAAVALEIWPVVLVVLALATRRWRELAGVAAGLLLLLVLPTGVLALWRPPAHPPRVTGWAGTAAPLDLSLPAIALRLDDPPRDGLMPPSWTEGSSGDLSWRHRALGAGSAAIALLLGLAWLLADDRGESDPVTTGVGVLALVPVALPVAWYHYQVLLLPAIALLVARGLTRRRAWLVAIALLLLAAATWNHPWSSTAYVHRFGWTAVAPLRLWVATTIATVADVIVIALLRVTATPRARQG